MFKEFQTKEGGMYFFLVRYPVWTLVINMAVWNLLKSPYHLHKLCNQECHPASLDNLKSFATNPQNYFFLEVTEIYKILNDQSVFNSPILNNNNINHSIGHILQLLNLHT